MDEDSLSVYRAMLEDQHLHGECVPVAVALHEAYGLPLVAVRIGGDRLVHAGVRDDDKFRDIRGCVDQKRFIAPYDGLGPLSIVPVGLDDLKSEGSYTKRQYENARRSLALLFPDFPDAIDKKQRLEAFERDMTDLCRRHGFWLRPATPNGMVLYEAYGDERGFRFTPIAPSQCVVERVLGAPVDIADEDFESPSP